MGDLVAVFGNIMNNGFLPSRLWLVQLLWALVNLKHHGKPFQHNFERENIVRCYLAESVYEYDETTKEMYQLKTRARIV